MKLGDEFKNYTISEGTCKRDDIFDAIERFLSNNEIEDDEIVSLVDEYREQELFIEQEQIGAGDALDDIYNDLWDALDCAAPDGCYFGAQEGDGALIGFWESSFLDIKQDGEEGWQEWLQEH